MNIRNFCIIAHIDHGKSTLADRMLEITWTIRKLEHNQVLDRMDIEQERWITIKLTPARMQWKWYEFNLIDTPGHVDFQYEVSRSLAAVEGAILLVDASQWIQAQTLSVLYQAIDQNLVIIPVLNKIDLPAANPERVAKELENLIWIDTWEIIKVSGKTGENVDKVLDAIIERIQDPQNFKLSHPKKYRTLWNEIQENSPNLTRALIFDSVYDPYKWVLAYVKIINGEMKAGSTLHLVHSENIITPTEVGYFTPEYKADKTLKDGQIWYIVTWEKSVREVQIGDTILTHDTLKAGITKNSCIIPWFKKVKPFVYAGVYPMDSTDYDKLKDSLEKLSLNDSAIEYELEDSKALGFGFRCGFLGMLHMDIIKERLSREYGMETIFTIPTVVYLVRSKNLALDVIKLGNNVQSLIQTGLWKQLVKDKEKYDEDLFVNGIPSELQAELKPWMVVKSWADMVEQWLIEEIREPIANVEIVWPQEFAGNIMQLCQEYRGKLKHMDYIDSTRVVRHYQLPMGEMIIDFYDRLKSATKGYATMNYEFQNYQEADLVKLDIFINNEKVEALSWVVHNDNAYYKGRDAVERLKELIPKHLFSIPIQAGIGTKMIARETISAMKKDVLAKCYGGDVSRKRKLLEKQKEGKKKLKAIGNVSVPSDVFIKMVARG